MVCAPYSEHWISVIDNMCKAETMEPTVWLGRTFSDKPFSGLRIEDIGLAFPSKEEAPASNMLSDFTFEQLFSIMKIYDRYTLGHERTFEERLRRFEGQIAHWTSVLETHQIDRVVFSNTPHLIFDYALHLSCQRLSIPTVCSHFTAVKNLLFVNSGTDHCPRSLGSNEFLDDFQDQALWKSKTHDEFLFKDNNERWYMKTQAEKARIKLSWVPPSKWRRTISNRLAFHRLEKDYLSSCSEAPSAPFVFFPLHYQPEATTVPHSGSLADQVQTAKRIASLLPEGHTLVVKEHTTTFRPNLQGRHGRSKAFWRTLAAIPNVVLVDHRASSQNLITTSEAVVTICGTASWEAAINGIRSIALAPTWFWAFEGFQKSLPSIEGMDSQTSFQTWLSSTPGTVNTMAQDKFLEVPYEYLRDPTSGTDPESAKRHAAALMRFWSQQTCL